MADANNVPESHDERRARISELMAREATAAKEGRIAEAEHLYLERSHFEAACRLQDMEQDEDAYPEDVELARYGLTVITAGLKLTAAAAAAGGAQQSATLGIAHINSVPESDDERRARDSELRAREVIAAKAGRIPEAEHIVLQRMHFSAACRLQDLERDENEDPEEVAYARHELAVLTAGVMTSAAAAAAAAAEAQQSDMERDDNTDLEGVALQLASAQLATLNTGATAAAAAPEAQHSATPGIAHANNMPESIDERRARKADFLAREATAAKAGRIAEAKHLILQRLHFSAACRLQDLERDKNADPRTWRWSALSWRRSQPA